MLAVVDTNVWVSAFLTPSGAAARVLAAFRKGRLTPLYSREVEAEYREVLSRPKFGISTELVDAFIERLRAEGRLTNPAPFTGCPLPDPDDAPFIALALSAGCPVITGNTRHFPPEAGVEVVTPSAFLARMGV